MQHLEYVAAKDAVAMYVPETAIVAAEEPGDDLVLYIGNFDSALVVEGTRAEIVELVGRIMLAVEMAL